MKITFCKQNKPVSPEKIDINTVKPHPSSRKKVSEPFLVLKYCLITRDFSTDEN